MENKNKGILIIIIIIVIGLGTIFAVNYTNNDGTEKNPIKNNELITNNDTNNTSEINTPKAGYGEITLGGLKFYVEDKFLNSYSKNEYLDTFKGGKDYGIRQEELDVFPNESYASFYPYEVEDFHISISDIKNPEYVDEIGGFENSKQNLSFKNITINGNQIRIAKTGQGFSSQGLIENQTTAFFSFKGKWIFIVWTNQDYDKYLLETFFKIN